LLELLLLLESLLLLLGLELLLLLRLELLVIRELLLLGWENCLRLELLGLRLTLEFLLHALLRL